MQKKGVFLVSLILLSVFCASLAYAIVDESQPAIGQVTSGMIFGQEGVITSVSDREMFARQIPESVTIPGDLMSQRPEPAKFYGYIVEFEDEPLIVQETRLRKEAEKNKNYVEKAEEAPLYKVGTKVKGTYTKYVKAMPEDVADEVKDYEKELKENHEAVKERIKNKIAKLKGEKTTGRVTGFFSKITGRATDNSELKVLNEYEKVFNGVALNISAEESREIEKVDGVKSIQPNYEVKAMLMDSVPLINADDVWQLDADGNSCASSGKDCLTGKGITIAVIDTGVDYMHGDLGGCFGAGCKVIDGYDFVNNDNDPMDDNGHGTHVAATVAGNGVLKGVAPDAKLYAYKVLSAGGSGSFEGIIAGIERAVDPNQDGNFSDHADIISMSLGGYGNPDDVISSAVDNAVNAGVVAVIAAGNSGPGENTIGSPGTARKAITVGATDKTDAIAYFSSRGPVIWTDSDGNEKAIIKPDVVAPGVNICAAQWNNAWQDRQCLDTEHTAISGTSMATPHVAGAAALLKQKNPGWTPEEIKMALRSTAVGINEPVTTQGYGRMDVLGATNFNGIPSIAKIETGEKVYGTINIIGTASGREFNRYTLYYSLVKNQDEWIELITSTTSVENGVLYSNLNTSLFDEADYYLKLEVWNNNNEISEDVNIINVNNLEITFPWDRSILRKGDIIEIKGKVSEFNQISIKYSQGLYFNIKELESATWKTEGIEVNMAYNGDGASEGVLARWDTSNLEDDFYNLKLEIRNSQEFIYPIFLDSKLKEGWPIYLNSFNTFLASEIYQPDVQDLDGDNKKEIIFVYRAGRDSFNQIAQLIVYNSAGSIKWSKELPPPHSWTPCNKVVGDVDNDGFSEIFVECTTQICTHQLYGFKHNGDKYGGTEWPLSLEGCDPYTLNIADLNSDGINELIAYGGDRVITPGEDYRKIVLFIGTEGILKEILIPVCDKLRTEQDYAPTSAIGNFDNDIDLEVVSRYGCNGVVAYNFDGSFVDGWPKYVDGLIIGDLSVGDINADGYDEVMVPTHPLYYENKVVFSGGLYVLNKNGVLNGWPFNESKAFTAPVALADLDGNKKLEIIAQAEGNGRPKFILSYDGKKFPGWPPQKQPTVGTIPVRSASVAADLDGDKKIDAVFKDGGFTAAIYNGRLDALGGVLAYNLEGNPIDLNIKYNQINALLLGFWPSYATTLITDLEENGKIDLISTSLVSTLNKNVVALYIHELDAPYNKSNIDWPMFMHDPQHTGCYDCEKIIAKTCSEIYRVPARTEGCLKEMCGNDKIISCQRAGYISVAICNKTVLSGECSRNKTAVCQNGNWINCLSDEICENDSCVKKVVTNVTCNDTDNGQDIYVKGTAQNNTFMKTDYCYTKTDLKYGYSVTHLMEQYCNNSLVKEAEWICPVGYECKDGACINKSVTCIDSDNGKNFFLKGSTTAKNVTRTDSCSWERDKGFIIKEYYCENSESKETSYICPGNCIDGACIQAVQNQTITCTDSDGGINYYIQGTFSGMYNGTLLSNEDACLDPANWDETSSSEWLGEGYCENNVLKIMRYKCQNGCSNGACIGEPQKEATQTCTDSDGLDYSIKGNVVGYRLVNGNLEKYSYFDGCHNSSSLVEFYCEGNNIKGTGIIPCENGCKDGACIGEQLINQTIQCTDSDGGANFDVKGTTGIPENMKEDYCRDAGSVIELTCAIDYVGWRGDWHDCHLGCSNGACLTAPSPTPTPSQPTCTDSDKGKNYLVKGSTTVVKADGTTETNTDSCNKDGTIKEWYCQDNAALGENVKCPAGRICSNGACIRFRFTGLATRIGEWIKGLFE